MRVGRTRGLWAAMGYVSTAEAPSLPSLLTDRLVAYLLSQHRQKIWCVPLHHVFSIGAGAPGRPECAPAECPHQHACE